MQSERYHSKAVPRQPSYDIQSTVPLKMRWRWRKSAKNMAENIRRFMTAFDGRPPLSAFCCYNRTHKSSA